MNITNERYEDYKMAVPTMDEINAEWAKDAEDFKNNSDVIRHSQEQYALHQKYHNWYNQLRLKLIRSEAELEKLKKEKIEYFSGEMDLATIKEKGWPLKPKLYAKSEIPKLVMTEDDIIILVQNIGYYKTTIDFVSNIIGMITFRHMAIKNILDYEKFVSGNI